MVLPPEVTRKSRARSTRRSAPSRHSPTSPVRSQPSAPFTSLRRFLIAPIALEQVRTPHQHFAVIRQADVQAFGRRADIARARKRATLTGDDAAGFLGLAVHLDDIDAIDLPKRRRLGRQSPRRR